MRNIADKFVVKNQNTHFVFGNVSLKNLADYGKMWKNIVERGKPQMTIWHLRTAFWILKATNTRTQVV
jgi:hypothetical protein